MVPCDLQHLLVDAPQTWATVQFLKDVELCKREKPYYIGYSVPLGDEKYRSNYVYDSRQVLLHDIRSVRDQLHVKRNGFEVLTIPPKLMEEYFSDDKDKLAHATGATEILKSLFDTDLIFCHDYAEHKEQPRTMESRHSNYVKSEKNLIIHTPHSDHTPDGGIRRARRHFKDINEPDYVSEGRRIRIVNFWKPIRNALRSAPLAFCDYSSIKPDGLVFSDELSAVYQGESAYLFYDPNQRWLWIRDQQQNEAIIFVNFDTHPTDGVPTTFHSSCVLQEDPPLDAPPRYSIEMRVLVVENA